MNDLDRSATSEPSTSGVSCSSSDDEHTSAQKPASRSVQAPAQAVTPDQEMMPERPVLDSNMCLFDWGDVDRAHAVNTARKMIPFDMNDLDRSATSEPSTSGVSCSSSDDEQTSAQKPVPRPVQGQCSSTAIHMISLEMNDEPAPKP